MRCCEDSLWRLYDKGYVWHLVLYRAKKVCVVIGQKRALWYAVNHVTVTERNTKLKERLQGKTVTMTYKRHDEENDMDLAAENNPQSK